MKKFSERSEKGRRNLIILYTFLGLMILSIFVFLNDFSILSNQDSSSPLYEEPSFVPTPTNISLIKPTESAITPSFEPTSEQVADLSSYVSSMLSCVGGRVSNISDNNIINGFGSDELVQYSFSNMGKIYKRSDFLCVGISDLCVGDLAVSDVGYGIYLGTYNGFSTFIFASNIGNIYNVASPVVSLVFDKKQADLLCNGWFPVDFTSYYHFEGNPYFSAELDFSSYDFALSDEEIEFASRIYDINKAYYAADYGTLASKLNTKFLSKRGYCVSNDLFRNYFISSTNTFLNSSSLSVLSIDDLYIGIQSIYKSSSASVLNLLPAFTTNDSSIIAGVSFKHSLFSDGTFLPFDVFMDKNLYPYGFVYLESGDSFADENNMPKGISFNDGVLVQKNDGRWVIRTEYSELDITDIINQYNKKEE